jgi:predicted lactoylglutathione lyase
VLLSRSAAPTRRAIERARAAGARIVSEPEQKPWGYTATFADPDHHLWEVIAT